MDWITAALIFYATPFAFLGYYITLRAVTALFGQERE